MTKIIDSDNMFRNQAHCNLVCEHQENERVKLENAKELCDIHNWDYIGTYSGKPLHIYPLRKEDVRIEDIATSLSKIPRFNGQTKFEDKIISVAEHSIHVAARVIEQGGTDADAYAALLHDAAEAYMCDLPSPFKAGMPDYTRTIEDAQLVIYDALGATGYDYTKIKKADYEVFVTEAKESMNGWEMWGIENEYAADIDIKYLGYAEAKNAFLKWHHLLKAFANK